MEGRFFKWCLLILVWIVVFVSYGLLLDQFDLAPVGKNLSPSYHYCWPFASPSSAFCLKANPSHQAKNDLPIRHATLRTDRVRRHPLRSHGPSQAPGARPLRLGRLHGEG